MRNDHTWNWKEVLAGVYGDSTLGPLFFITFIYDIYERIQYNIKILADDTSIFSTMKSNNRDSAILSEDLNITSNLTFSWKLSLNPDLS